MRISEDICIDESVKRGSYCNCEDGIDFTCSPEIHISGKGKIYLYFSRIYIHFGIPGSRGYSSRIYNKAGAPKWFQDIKHLFYI